jgi:hypothetical protein
MNAKTALELGAPIRGILAFTSTSTFVFHQLQMAVETHFLSHQ